MWGTPSLSGERIYSERFIPTCVGNSVYCVSYSTINTVHPHVCGELGITNHSKIPLRGSSPRVWGTHFSIFNPLYARRFIPTCVGNSDATKNHVFVISVHPHVCGELQCPRKISTFTRRFIPTCVGNSLYCLCPQFTFSVHPHVCGELISCRLMPASVYGSSPRVWGTHLL